MARRVSIGGVRRQALLWSLTFPAAPKRCQHSDRVDVVTRAIDDGASAPNGVTAAVMRPVGRKRLLFAKRLQRVGHARPVRWHERAGHADAEQCGSGDRERDGIQRTDFEQQR